jgi:hypothetical protein
MPEAFSVCFATDIPHDGLALEGRASACNPHALPPSLQATRTSGIACSWLECRASDGALAGLWPMAPAHMLPGISVLQAPVYPRFDLVGTPLVEATRAATALRSMLMALKGGLTPCTVLSVRNMQADGALWDTLLALQSEGLIAITVLDCWERALLERSFAADAESYLAACLSSGSRKRLRAKRRALEDQGRLHLEVHTVPHGIAGACETFLALEAAGWKGRAGSALQQTPGDARYVTGVLTAMAADERGFIAELRSDGRCIASGLFLRCGGSVFFWKTTYDETLAKESPGVIFDMMLTEWLYTQPWFERLDTGSDDSVDPATLIWKQRRRMANIVINLEPNALGAKVYVASQRLRRWAKEWRNRVWKN